ncbi:MAG: FAD-dependent thymidylate synthase [Thermoplasmata archaeon]
MKVRLLACTPDAEKLCAASGHSCYSNKPAGDIFDNITQEESKEKLDKIIGLGHLSVIEHACFTFSLEGVSRVLTHQLVRHRIASFSQQSQRYVILEKPDYVIPNEIKSNEECEKIYRDALDKIWDAYNKLIGLGINAEDARYLLPNAAKTNIVVTMNARELMHFFRLRTCNRAQWEIREAANLMLNEAKKIAPKIFEKAGPPCEVGPCPEGKKSCGRYKGKKK